jgi:hypothetical protein
MNQTLFKSLRSYSSYCAPSIMSDVKLKEERRARQQILMDWKDQQRKTTLSSISRNRDPNCSADKNQMAEKNQGESYVGSGR